MSKIIIFGLFAFFLSANLYAGDYDGLWQLPYDGGSDLQMIRQVDNHLLMMGFDMENGNTDGWWADFGTISGNIAQMSSALDDGDSDCTLEFTLSFPTATSAIMVVTSLIDGICEDDAVGDTHTMTKLF